MERGPLQGVRVLDLTRLLPGPTAAWLLLGQGASVDVVEPLSGDATRWMPPAVDGAGAWFAALRRGARSLALDFRHAAAPDLLAALLPRYDVVLEGFRPGVLERLVGDAEALAAAGLVVVRISGWGQTGPWRDRPGHDLNYMAAAGALDGADAPLPVQVADQMGGALAAFSVASALVGRTRSGRGAVLDIALSDAALAAMAPTVAIASASGRAPEPRSGLLTGGSTVYRIARCADGTAAVASLEPKFQAELAVRSGGEVDAALAAADRDTLRRDWAEACVSPVLDAIEASRLEHHERRRAVVTVGDVRWVRPPLADDAWERGSVPRLGEQTDVILSDAGLDAARVAAWRTAGLFG
jgi:crotonobetainyl-CoA:carnitine CoA-transferase CaiB-like acyl-CoA transferase